MDEIGFPRETGLRFGMRNPVFFMRCMGWCGSQLSKVTVEFPLLELAACGIDVAAAGIPDRGLYPARLQPALEFLDLFDGRRLEGAVGDVVELDEVHVAERSLTEVAECLHLRVRIVYPFDHGKFVCRAPSRLLGVFLERFVEAKKRVLLHSRHELIPRGLDGRVQGNGKRELLRKVRERADARNDAAG